jgi:hypothetical protein
MTSANEDPPRSANHAWSQGTHNDGVHISGGSFSGPIAAGYQAQAVQFNHAAAGDSDLAQLEDLLRQLEAGVRDLGGARADDAVEDIGRVHSELARGNPDRPRISQLMDRIMAVVVPVSSLLELAERAKELITIVLH